MFFSICVSSWNFFSDPLRWRFIKNFPLLFFFFHCRKTNTGETKRGRLSELFSLIFSSDRRVLPIPHTLSVKRKAHHEHNPRVGLAWHRCLLEHHGGLKSVLETGRKALVQEPENALPSCHLHPPAAVADGLHLRTRALSKMQDDGE